MPKTEWDAFDVEQKNLWIQITYFLELICNKQGIVIWKIINMIGACCTAGWECRLHTNKDINEAISCLIWLIFHPWFIPLTDHINLAIMKMNE